MSVALVVLADDTCLHSWLAADDVWDRGFVGASPDRAFALTRANGDDVRCQ